MSLSEGVYNSTFTGNLNHSNFTASGFRTAWEAPYVMSMVILTVSVLLGVPGNGAVIWVTGFKMKRTAHTVCYLNLSVADLMFCLCLPAFMVEISELHSGNVGNIVSPIIRTIAYINAFASVNLLCLISIYRCLAITRPIWFQQHLSLTWVRVTCFVVWVIGAMSLPVFILRIISNTALILAVLSFGLPFVIMIACYAFIGWTLHGNRLAKSRKPLRLLVAAVAAFIICWLPFGLCILLPTNLKIVPLDWIIFTHALASFNSALNPLVYVFAGNDYRQVFRRSLFASLQLAFTEQELQAETQSRNPISNSNV